MIMYFKTNDMKNFTHQVRKTNITSIQIWLMIFSILILVSIQVTAQGVKFYKLSGPVSKSVELLNDPSVDTERLNNLLTNLNSTIYFSKGNLQLNESGSPVVVDTDAQSFSELYKENSDFNQVEIIKINLNSISDMSASLDLSKLISFYQLKYIYVEIGYDACGGQSDDCLLSETQSLVKNTDSNAVVIFKLSIPN